MFSLFVDSSGRVLHLLSFSKFMMPSLHRKLLLLHGGDPPESDHPHPKHNTPITMSIMTFAVAASLLFGFLVAIIRQYCLRHNARGSSTPIRFRTRVDSLREDDHGRVDHPIWLINTVGLDQSVIDSIAVCEFKEGGGLIDGVECTICLGEFEEGEDLRLLPKCSHAFHVSCIDTWLRSHKNCPLCRAPIVRDVQLPCGEINLEESRLNRGILERSSSTMVSGNGDAGEHNLEGQGGSRGENEVRKEKVIRLKRLSSIDSSSVMKTHWTTEIDNRCRFAKETKGARDAVCKSKNGESSRNKIRRSSSDAGILSFEKNIRQTPINAHRLSQLLR